MGIEPEVRPKEILEFPYYGKLLSDKNKREYLLKFLNTRLRNAQYLLRLGCTLNELEN